jgi:hypothetical protein
MKQPKTVTQVAGVDQILAGGEKVGLGRSRGYLCRGEDGSDDQKALILVIRPADTRGHEQVGGRGCHAWTAEGAFTL